MHNEKEVYVGNKRNKGRGNREEYIYTHVYIHVFIEAPEYGSIYGRIEGF